MGDNRLNVTILATDKNTIKIKATGIHDQDQRQMCKSSCEEANVDFFGEGSMEHVDKCWQDSGIDKRNVLQVIFIEGSRRTSCTQKMILLFNGKEATVIEECHEAMNFESDTDLSQDFFRERDTTHKGRLLKQSMVQGACIDTRWKVSWKRSRERWDEK